jgi:hypothetical protein
LPPDFTNSTARPIDWQSLEAASHRDPIDRGLASFRLQGEWLDTGQLQAIAMHMAQRAAHVGIVTGFCVATPQGITAETDGPPGALYLARALQAVGCQVTLLTDRPALPLLGAGYEHLGWDPASLVEFPMQGEPHWIERFFDSQRAARITHLIAIERPGRSHTLTSLCEQSRIGPLPREAFLSHVPPAEQDICHNMRGESIEAHTAPMHLLFEHIAQERLPIATIGIGDGGNELGMGRFPWEILVEAVGTPAAPQIVSRVATDFVLLAGVSNWGAYALALATTELRGGHGLARPWHSQAEREMIEAMVRNSPAVDGITLRREPTVDGLSLPEYLQPLVDMRRLLGFDDPPRV